MALFSESNHPPHHLLMFKSHPILYLYLKLKSILSSDPSVAFLSNSLFYHLLLKSYYMVMVSSWTVAITCQGYPYRLQHGETCPPIRGACGSPSLFLNNLQKNIDSKLLMMHYVNLLREGFIKKGQSLPSPLKGFGQVMVIFSNHNKSP